jgi:acetoin utilization protein AcuB
MLVRAWMTADPVTIGPRDSLVTAQEKLDKGGFRRLPVVDEQGVLIGIVTDRDMRRHHGYYTSTLVDGAMTEKVVTVRPDDPLAQAAELMLRHKIDGLPVVREDGALVGIITSTDLTRALVRLLESPAGGGARGDVQR